MNLHFPTDFQSLSGIPKDMLVVPGHLLDILDQDEP